MLEAAPGLASEPFLPLLPRPAARCPQRADGSGVGGGSPGPPGPRLVRPPGAHRGTWAHIDWGLGHLPCAGSRARCRGGHVHPPFSGSLVRGGAGRKPTSATHRAAGTRRKKAPVREP